MTAAALLLGAPLLLAVVASPAPPTHEIAVAVRGPVALVEVTRTLPADPARGGERLVDVALPEGAGLIDVRVREAGRRAAWRELAVADGGVARAAYDQRFTARGLEPAREPFDDATDFRIRVAPATGDPRAALDVRYRFSLVPTLTNGRRRIRFPASPDRLPVPADVHVLAPGTTDLQIAGASARGAATRVPARSAWEISWAGPARGPAGDRPALSVSLATAPRTGGVTVAATIDARAGRDVGPPPHVLFVIDRSASVGPAGAATERDLARKLLESLPPSTRFDALFFDHAVARLFPMSRPATREALAAIDAELVPDRLHNGTDLPAALRAAGELLRRETSAFAPRVLVAIVTDGALPTGADAPTLDGALGPLAGLGVEVAAWIVRPVDDAPAPSAAVAALRGLAARRGGVARELRANELDEALAPALATLGAGGDVAALELAAGGRSTPLADRLAPGESHATLLFLPAPLGTSPTVWGVAGGAKVRAVARIVEVDAAWLAPLLPGVAPAARLVATDAFVALVEPVAHAAPAVEPVVKGSLDREVVRNTLALAYLPRARACYLSRSGATPAARDLAGRVRLDIEIARGEVARVDVTSSTLGSPPVEACLRDGALALDVPRALRNDFPVTARLNLVFRPRTPEKPTTADEAALGAKIDLVIEDMHREDLHKAEAPPVTETPTPDRSMIPTR